MDRSKDWIRQAERDLKRAKLDIENAFYEWACFTSQQAAEKSVKALYQTSIKNWQRRRFMLQETSLGSVIILSVDYDIFLRSIKEAAAEIKQKHNHVRNVLLFGSFVKKNYTPQSDVDILIIVENDSTVKSSRNIFHIILH